MSKASDYAVWQAADGRDAKKAGNGARALMAGILLRWPHAKSWGIYNYRSTALGNPSAHGEGRALDIGCNLRTGHAIVKKLRKIGPRYLGISVIIHDRVLYSRRSPNGVRYNGVPHRDHVHIELTRKAASRMKLIRVKRVLGL